MAGCFATSTWTARTSNARLIREGYGHAIRRFRYSLKAQFIRLEDSARKSGPGVMVPALRPGLDQRALDGGGPAAAPDPTASVRLRAFSSTIHRPPTRRRSRGRGLDSPIVPCGPRSMGVSPCAAAGRRKSLAGEW